MTTAALSLAVDATRRARLLPTADSVDPFASALAVVAGACGTDEDVGALPTGAAALNVGCINARIDEPGWITLAGATLASFFAARSALDVAGGGPGLLLSLVRPFSAPRPECPLPLPRRTILGFSLASGDIRVPLLADDVDDAGRGLGPRGDGAAEDGRELEPLAVPFAGRDVGRNGWRTAGAAAAALSPMCALRHRSHSSSLLKLRHPQVRQVIEFAVAPLRPSTRNGPLCWSAMGIASSSDATESAESLWGMRGEREDARAFPLVSLCRVFSGFCRGN
jgi:hypothetical protein